MYVCKNKFQMILNILIGDKIYPTKVEKNNSGFNLKFYDREKQEFWAFIHFSNSKCSIKCNLQHWRAIKKEFAENYNAKAKFWHEELNS